MNTTPDQAEVAELSATLDEITAAWDPTNSVDTNLGINVQHLGERLCALLDGLTLNPEVSTTVQDEAGATQLTLRAAVNHYAALDERDTAAALDIYELLPAALRLVGYALRPRRQPASKHTLPLAFPDWQQIAEPYADGTDPIERYVATLVVGDDAGATEGEVTGPKQAALAALNLTRDEQARSTVWHVYDRHTGITHRFDQSEFDNVAGHDIAEVLAEEAQATERGRDMDAIYVRAAAADAAVVGDTLVLPPSAHAALEAVAVACADTASGQLTRTQIETQYGHDLPEEMGEGPFHIYPGIDPGPPNDEDSDPELCTVARAGDCVFCLTCEAHGYLDGYLPDAADVERWHRDL